MKPTAYTSLMSFRLNNTLATFMVLMNRVFHKHLHDFVNVFVDDILIYSDNEEDHERYLRTELEMLMKNKLYAKRNECDFWMKEVSFLSHFILNEGISIDPVKIEVVTRWKQPKRSQR